MISRAALTLYAHVFVLCVAVCGGAPVLASGTPAGTSIDNFATATWDGAGGTQSTTSNLVKLRVDELLGVAVASSDPGPVPAANGDIGKVLKFQVTNAGNGSEAFVLSALSTVGGDDFDPALTSIVVDTNGNGAYDAGVDTVYVAGAGNPVLAPDASIAIFAVSTMPAIAADGARGTMRLSATAATGSGTPGTLLAGLGQGGGDAVVGVTTGRAEADGAYLLASVAVAFVKTATTADPFGGIRALPGSVITYSLVATLTGSGSLTNLKLSDTIPAGTAYQPGSLMLNGAALTDTADADGGLFAANAVSVTLPTAAAGSAHFVSFKVKIN